MTTLDSLRAELEARAATSDGGGDAPARAVAVRQRIAGIRRRRRATLAGGVVTALVVAAGGLGLLRPAGPEPASRVLAGATAPATFVSAGYTYVFDHGVESRGDDRLVLELDASDQPRLVSWTAGSQATLRVPGDSWNSTGLALPSRFADFEWVPPGWAARYVLKDATAQPMAFAVYAVSGTPPAGYTKDGITFRDDIDGSRLLAARLGDVGQTEVTTQVVIPSGQFGQAFLCESGVRDAWVVYTLDDRVIGGSDCGGHDDVYDRFDPGAGGQFFARPHIKVGTRVFRPGDVVTLGVRLQRGRTDPTPVVDPTARLGVAGYAHRRAETVRHLAPGLRAGGHHESAGPPLGAHHHAHGCPVRVTASSRCGCRPEPRP
ncbi:MAG: hypothetical protein R2734_11760 [Nocardioides sp.]